MKQNLVIVLSSIAYYPLNANHVLAKSSHRHCMWRYVFVMQQESTFAEGERRCSNEALQRQHWDSDPTTNSDPTTKWIPLQITVFSCNELEWFAIKFCISWWRPTQCAYYYLGVWVGLGSGQVSGGCNTAQWRQLHWRLNWHPEISNCPFPAAFTIPIIIMIMLTMPVACSKNILEKGRDVKFLKQSKHFPTLQSSEPNNTTI